MAHGTFKLDIFETPVTVAPQLKFQNFKFFKNSLKILNIYFGGDTVYFWGNDVDFSGDNVYFFGHILQASHIQKAPSQELW